MNLKAQPLRPINLLLGWPNPSLLPPENLLKSSETVLSYPQIWKDALTYGPDEGYRPLREEVARWLTRFYGPKDAISPERICITGGASQNLACLLQTFTDPVYTRACFMVAPTYFHACKMFEDSGFAGRMKAVPEDAEGLEIDCLRRMIRKVEDDANLEGNVEPKLKPFRPWRKIFKHIIYAVPSFANPSSRIMSLERREQLVRVAREYDALVITDDVYDMLQWRSGSKANSGSLQQAHLPRIVDVDRYLDGGPKDDFGHAVSNGSFSKIVAPGCRTGWTEGTDKMAFGVSQTGSSRSGGCPSQLVAACIQQMLATSALEQHIEQDLKPAYERRYRSMLGAIEEYLLPLGVTIPQADADVAGGYFFWLTLPEGLNARKIAARALDEESLTIIAGPMFHVVGDKDDTEANYGSNVRLSFAWEDEEFLAEGVQRLAAVIKRVLED